MTDSRSKARRTVRTMCPMNCHPTLCGILVDVEDGRLGATGPSIEGNGIIFPGMYDALGRYWFAGVSFGI